MDVSPSAALHSALVGVFDEYVDAARRDRGYVEPPGWSDALAAGRHRLDRELDELLSQPFPAQRRSPLELFQGALLEPTASLAAAGVPQPERDEGKRRALPGDIYDLAPASSEQLGEDVWRAHLAWGAAKAAAMASTARVGPRVAYFGSNLMDRTTIESAADRRRLGVAVLATVEDVDDAIAGGGLVRAFVDLTHPAADDAIRLLGSTRTSVVAFGPHVDDFAMTRARSLGADEAVPRSRFFRKLNGFFPDMV